MEFLGVCIQNIISRFSLCECVFVEAAFSGGVVDHNSGLNIIAVYIEAYAVSLVLNAVSLHLHAAGNKLVAVKDGGHSVENVIARFLDIVRNHIFEGQHPFYVYITCSGDEILLVVVLACELETDEVAAVIKIFSVDKGIGNIHPSGGLDVTDALSVFRGHKFLTYAGHSHAAASQFIQRTEIFKGCCCFVFFGEGGAVAVYYAVGFTRVFGNGG